MTIRIDIPEEGVSVTATCGRCHSPLSRAGGSVSWACDNADCPTRIIPMWEDARFVDDTGRQWIFTDDGDWIDVVEDSSEITEETDEERIERLTAKVRDHLHADAMRAVADPADDFGPDDVTTWRIVVEIEPAEIDPETGEEDMPETITATAYDNNHHSNVLFVTFNGEEIEEVG